MGKGLWSAKRSTLVAHFRQELPLDALGFCQGAFAKNYCLLGEQAFFPCL